MSLARLISLPFRIAVSILIGTYNFAATILPFLPQIHVAGLTYNTNRSLPSPQALAERFLLEFEESYGTVHPDFYQNGYSQALEQMKQEVRYLVVYLHSEEHDKADEFCRKTLSSLKFVEFLRSHNVIFWAGNIKESDPFQVSIALGATAYPFIALLALANPPSGGTKPVVVARIEGMANPEELSTRLKEGIDRHDLFMATIRSERQERDTARRIREQQDEAYAESLRRDQERERLQREEQERQRKKEEENNKLEKEMRMMIDQRKTRRQRLRQSLPEEPFSSSNTTRIQFRLPNGNRTMRTFYYDDTIELLYQYIESLDPFDQDNLDPTNPNLELPESMRLENEFDFVLVAPFPRQEYTDRQLTVKDANLLNGNIMVEER